MKKGKGEEKRNAAARKWIANGSEMLVCSRCNYVASNGLVFAKSICKFQNCPRRRELRAYRNFRFGIWL